MGEVSRQAIRQMSMVQIIDIVDFEELSSHSCYEAT